MCLIGDFVMTIIIINERGIFSDSKMVVGNNINYCGLNTTDKFIVSDQKDIVVNYSGNAYTKESGLRVIECLRPYIKECIEANKELLISPDVFDTACANLMRDYNDTILFLTKDRTLTLKRMKDGAFLLGSYGLDFSYIYGSGEFWAAPVILNPFVQDRDLTERSIEAVVRAIKYDSQCGGEVRYLLREQLQDIIL